MSWQWLIRLLKTVKEINSDNQVLALINTTEDYNNIEEAVQDIADEIKFNNRPLAHKRKYFDCFLNCGYVMTGCCGYLYKCIATNGNPMIDGH